MVLLRCTRERQSKILERDKVTNKRGGCERRKQLAKLVVCRRSSIRPQSALDAVKMRPLNLHKAESRRSTGGEKAKILVVSFSECAAMWRLLLPLIALAATSASATCIDQLSVDYQVTRLAIARRAADGCFCRINISTISGRPSFPISTQRSFFKS